MPIDYMQMLLDLMTERQRWIGERDEAIREISRLSELIRATMNMVPPEKLARYEPIFERLDNRPLGLSMAIRSCFTDDRVVPSTSMVGKENPERKIGPRALKQLYTGKEWLTPVEIRDRLKNMGFPFENYKANPLASIHTTLKRMVPGEMESKALKDGQKVYRLKSAGEWTRAFAEAREWMRSKYGVEISGSVGATKKRQNEDKAEEKPVEEKKHGPSGSS